MIFAPTFDFSERAEAGVVATTEAPAPARDWKELVLYGAILWATAEALSQAVGHYRWHRKGRP